MLHCLQCSSLFRSKNPDILTALFESPQIPFLLTRKTIKQSVPHTYNAMNSAERFQLAKSYLNIESYLQLPSKSQNKSPSRNDLSGYCKHILHLRGTTSGPQKWKNILKWSAEVSQMWKLHVSCAYL